jgi:ABC-2 type transport system permease protein
MKLLLRVYAIAALSLKPSLRQPLYIVLVSLLPFSFVLTFWLIGGASLSQHALYGLLVAFATNPGIISLPQIAVSYKISRLQEMYVASPVGPGLYAFGLGLSRLLFATPPVLAIFGVLALRGGMSLRMLPLAAAVVVCVALTAVLAGFTLSLTVPNLPLVSIVGNMLGLLLTVVPPVYYPLTMVPSGFRWLPLLTPTANAAQLLRIFGGSAHSSSGMTLLHWAILLTEGLLLAGVVLRRMRWQER